MEDWSDFVRMLERRDPELTNLLATCERFDSLVLADASML
jgi:hypothetical protein